MNREPMAPACHLDHLTDVLHGLNVRHWNYLDLDAQAKLLAERKAHYQGYPWDNFEPQWCWVVYVWNDGLDYDDEGNAYQDDAPDYHVSSYHLTQKGAEVEAAHWEDRGIKAHNIRVCEGYQEEYHYNSAILP
jgi:hypothetical protein